AELVDFAAACRLDFPTSLVAESASESVCPPSVGGECALGTDVLEDRKEEFECFATDVPHLVSMLLAPVGDPDAPNIPTPRSYVEAIEGPYSSQVKRPPGSPPVFKPRYVARGFSQRQGVDFFHTFSPTPKMTNLRVLLHVAAHRDYELHSLDFSTAFLQGSLHEEIWLRRPAGFTRSFPPGTQWSLRRPVYDLRQAPREWHNTLMTTLAALGFAPSTTDPSLFLRTNTLLLPFYVLVYIDDLVFATGDIEALAHVKSELQKRYTHRKVHWDAARKLLRYLCSMSSMGLVLGGRARVVLTGHADASWVDDLATQRSSQGYTFSLCSGSVPWRSARSSSVLSSSCEAEIYTGAMAAQELRWLTYLLSDLGEAPRSPPVLYVDNKAMLALCQEHILEHRTKHIALRYFLAQELQQRGQLRLAYVASQANTADVSPRHFSLVIISCNHCIVCFPPVPGTHSMVLRPSTPPQCVPLPSPPVSSLPNDPDLESDSFRAASPSIMRFLATADTDPLFESTVASALVAELVEFAAACRLDFATSLVAESASASIYPPSVGGECAFGTDVLEDRQKEFECFAAAVPHLVSTLLAPEGDPDAPDIPTPHSFAEAIEGPYSSQWQAAMDAEMASSKSTGTYIDEVPPPRANIVSGMYIFRVKQPSGSLPVFKARYVARGFIQRQGVDVFQNFSPTPKMTTLQVLLPVAAQRDYELHSLDFSTAFLQGSLHEEIWLRRPPGFTGSFPTGTQWSLQRPVYGLRQAPREWHDTVRTTLASLGFAPSTADPSLFLRTNTTLLPFYVLVYVDDLVFATADTEALAHVKSELQKRHTCADLGELTSYLGLRITRDRAQRTITLTQSHMVQQVLQRFGFTYSSPQSTSLPTSQSLSAPPSDNTSGMGLVLGRRARVVLTGHADASWVDDLATQRSSQGYTFSLCSGSVSWRSTRSSSVLSSSCEAGIYTGAMAAQELRWLTYPADRLGRGASFSSSSV
ncbi:unnamed protein product, partial [Closterium sp. NIES-53]